MAGNITGTEFFSSYRAIFSSYKPPDREPWDIDTQPPRPKRTRKRRMTLARAMRQASEAGIAVSAATVNADGSVTLTFGEAANGPGKELNEWDTVQ